MPIFRVVLALLVAAGGLGAYLACSSQAASAHLTIPSNLALRFEADAAVRPKQHRARAFFLKRIKARYGKDLSSVKTTVYWSKEKCPSGEIGLFHKIYNRPQADCYRGLHFSCVEIYVSETKSIGHSAFIHELGHCYFKHVFGKPEANNRHPDKAWWDFIDATDKRLLRWGW